MGRNRYLAAATAACIALLATTQLAAAETAVPDVLRDWIPWVLDGEEFRRCPFLAERDPADRATFVCTWPGRLELDAGATGARFAQSWDVRAESWVELPGNAQHWPLDVSVNGRPAPVTARGGTPALRLGAGQYRVTGAFAWERRPAQLAVPSGIGLVTVSVDGERILRPGRDGRDLWLGERPGAAPEQDALELRVYRRLADAIPMQLESRLTLDVSGQSREEVITHAVQPGFIAMALEAELPARVESDGSLRVQVRPGTWEITLQARAAGLPVQLEPVPSDGEEIWSYQSGDRLRVTVLEGADAVDPGQVGVPEEWRELPAFLVRPGVKLQITARGTSGTEANQLALRREIWRDFDGDGYTARDVVTGSMREGWRLDMRAPFRMASARAGGEPLLVTAAGEELVGVELREPEVDLEILARLPASSRLPASGYAQRFESMSALLHLPPAHRLLWAGGADSAPAAWVNRWTLLDLFLLLLIAVGAARLLGPLAGGIALAALLVSYHEPGAPVWSWVNLLAATALAKFAPEGRLLRAAKGYRLLSALALVVLLVPFVAGQARLLLHPQLETDTVIPLAVLMDAAAPEPAPSQLEGVTRERSEEEIVVTTRKREERAPRYAPDALVQAGPGVPQWQGHRYELRWSGPVAPEETLSLWILGRFGTALGRLLGIALTVTLFGLILRQGYGGAWRWPRAARAVAPVALVVAALVPAPPAAAADTPDAELLAELKRRLTKAPPCAPNCVAIESAAIAAEEDRLVIRLRVHSQEQAAVALPSAGDTWQPDSVSGAGTAVGVYRDAGNRLWAEVPRGVTELAATGSLAGLDSLSVAFPTVPRTVVASGRGWLIGGIRDGRLTSGALDLSRIRQSAAGARTITAGTFPAFAEVERSLHLGLDWTVTTTVRRIAPVRDAFNLEVDLLPGESVTTAEVDVLDGKARVAFAGGEDEVSWSATLPPGAELTLVAPEARPWSEVWRVSAAPALHVEYDGIGAVVPESTELAAWPEFRPRPGERLTLRVSRPAALPGDTLAVDSVRLASTIGQRSADSTLAFDYRSTRGGQQTLALPETAIVQSVSVDGESLPVRPSGGSLELPILPGEHTVELRWRNDQPLRAWQGSPVVGLGTDVANLRLQVELPENRWPLFAIGPGTGPAFLYWSELAVFIVVAILLGRSGWTPLGAREWLLLGVGFSTFSWPLLLIVALWFLALDRRGRADTTALPDWQFRAMQVLLGLITLIAIGALVSGIPQALLGRPDMHVVGEGSFDRQLVWFTDRAGSPLPGARVFSVHLWWYKAVMLAWALWIVFAFLRWLPWAWRNFSRDGIWRGRLLGTRTG